MAREILDNGQIQISDEVIINPLYWDEEVNDWKEYTFDEFNLSEEDKTWISKNLKSSDKDNYKAIFGAGKE